MTARSCLHYREGEFPARWRRAGFALLVSLLTANAARSQSAPPSPLPTLTTAEQIRELSSDQAKRGYPVHLRAVVTYDDSSWTFFVQDATAGIYVNDVNRKSAFQPGQLLDIEGVTEDPDFAPQITKTRYRVIGQSRLPQPRAATFDALMSMREDSQWVEFKGIVQGAVKNGNDLTLDLVGGGGHLPVEIPDADGQDGSQLIDANVRVEGVCQSVFNQKNQFVGVELILSSARQITIAEPAPADPFAAPVRSISSLLGFTAQTTTAHRVHVQGVVTLQKGSHFFIQNGSQALYVKADQQTPLQPGDRVDIAGFADVGDYTPILEHAVYRRIGSAVVPPPVTVTAQQAMSGEFDTVRIRLDGTLRDDRTTPTERMLVLQDENVMFDVRIPKDKAETGWPEVPLGSRLRVTGICSVHVDRRRVPDNFTVFPTSPSGIEVLSRPSWWTLRRIVLVAAVLAGLTLGVLAWVVVLRRRVASQTGVIRSRLENEALLERRFQYVAQATNDTIWDWNLLADTVWWSEGVRTTFGYPPDEMAPDATERWERLHPEDRDRVRSGLAAAIEGSGEHWSDEYRYRRADGAYAYVLDRGYIMRDPSGRPIRMIGAMMDITAQKHAEEALRQQRTILQSVIDHVPFAIFWMDRNCRFLGCNQHMAQRSALKSPENLIGKTLYDLPLGKEQLDAFVKRDQEIMESGEALLDLEESVTRTNGTSAVVSASKVPLRNTEGQVVGLVGIFADITERKHAEAELKRAKEAAEAANRAKSDFLANMSHEIRTPMNGILGMTDLALDTELTAEQRDYLEMVKTSADALLTVINDVLDFSKIEAGKLELDPNPFNLREHLAQSLKPLALRAHQKGLELTYEIGAEVPEVVVTDGSRLRQVVINLVGNAIKFTKQGEVGLKVAVESKADDQVSLHFTVHDTGIGVAPEKQRLIFEAFSQADSSMAREYGGTGLGLTISSRLVEMMNGRIWLESDFGKGSCFHFTTRVGIAAGSAWVPPLEPVEFSGMPVLVVDDNLTNLRILGDMLGRWKMKPVLAASGREAQIALENAEQSGAPFGLLLLDVNMPDMDGFKLAEQIRGQVSLRRTAIMMLSSAAQRGDTARCRELGVGAYLIKPIVQSQLLEAIRNLLGTAAHDVGPLRVPRRSLPEGTQRLRVLLAEDNLVNQKLATRLLENHGHIVTVAANGRDTLALLDQRYFDLVLMDVSMPAMDGFEATAAIRAREVLTGEHVPVIAMTAHAMTGDRERCLAAGMDGYVSKPIRAQDLFDSIESLLAVPA